MSWLYRDDDAGSICGGGRLADANGNSDAYLPAARRTRGRGRQVMRIRNIVRYGFAQTATHFYVFGGVSDGTRVNNVNRMDLATGTWEPRAPMPFTSEAPTCALMHPLASFIARRETPATASHATTLPPTPGRHWLPIPLLRITTARYRVPSTARCLWWVAPLLQ